MKSADFIKAHDRVKDFDWKASYHEPHSRYDMPYCIPKKTSDPFRAGYSTNLCCTAKSMRQPAGSC